MFSMKIILFLLNLFLTLSKPDKQCPLSMINNGLTKDLVILADEISQDKLQIMGSCGQYVSINTCHGPYDTRIRIYRLNSENTYVIVFRPTQQTPQGGDIHVDRYLTDCTYLNNNNQGKVHNRYQIAFISLFNNCKNTIDDFNDNSNIYITGHSLGGAFAIFMMTKLYFDYQIIPKIVYGFAGTFIGDYTYTINTQNIVKDVTDFYLIETVDKDNTNNFDGTSEGYNTNNNDIYIDTSSICGFYITPLPQWETYGMHDLKNYNSGIPDNTVCTL